MDAPDLPPEQPAPREVLWQQALIRASLQGLEDVATADAAEVLFSRSRRPSTAAAFFDQLGEAALSRGFAVARVSVLEERAFDTLDGLVRNLLLSLRSPGASSRARGWSAVLDRFAAAHPSPAAAVAAFDRAAVRFGAAGDLSVLSREYLDASPRSSRVAARLDAWASGTDLARVEGRVTALSSLTSLTARRALGELTRLLRALGHHGLLVIFEGAEVLTRLSPARRDGSFTVFRELIDNADGHGGMVAAKLLGLRRPHALRRAAPSRSSITRRSPRASRRSRPRPRRPSPAPRAGRQLPDGDFDRERMLLPRLGEVPRVPDARLPHLRALLRLGQGLPPLEATTELTVGLEEVDARIEQLFATSANDGSVFAVLVGEYGSGKTHHLLHLEARALAAKRPVMRLAVERLDEDIGNPQRHLRRLLESTVLPLKGRPSMFGCLEHWLSSQTTRAKLKSALVTLAGSDAEVSGHAAECLTEGELDERALVVMLSALDLVDRPASSSYRRDAYRRLLLWLELLARVEGCEGPVVILDEAENLYRPGVSRAERRTALRSLPDALTALRHEAGELLADVTEQRTVLPSEDAAMLRRRITWTRPVEVPELDASQRVVLAFRVRATHARVRGEVDDPRWASWVTGALSDAATPRELVRRVIDRLEGLWWRSGAAPTAHMFLNQS